MDAVVTAVRDTASAYGLDITEPTEVRVLPGDRRSDGTDAKAEYIGALDKLVVYGPAFERTDRMDTYLLHELDHKYQLDSRAGTPDAAFCERVQALEEGYQDYLDLIEDRFGVDRQFARREGVTDADDLYAAAAMQQMPAVVEDRVDTRSDILHGGDGGRRRQGVERFEETLFHQFQSNPVLTTELSPVLARNSAHETVPEPADEVFAYAISLTITHDTVPQVYYDKIQDRLEESPHYPHRQQLIDDLDALLTDYRDMRRGGIPQEEAVSDLITRQDAALSDED